MKGFLRHFTVLVFACAFFAISVVASFALARADQTTVGTSVNATSGAHVESQGTQAVPFIPLPMLEIDHVHGRVHLHAEGVPPIGPVALGQGGPFGLVQEPRLSYINAEAFYTFAGSRDEFGVGETILNQRTFYPPSPLVQASRVVGMRYSARAELYEIPGERLDANLAVNPSLHGIQYSMVPNLTVADAERGSMVDASLRWTMPHDRYSFAYGIRYIDYSARYTATGALADRNHFLMPFIAFDWNLHRAGSAAAPNRVTTELPLRPSREGKTAVGVSFFGAGGSHSVASGPTTARGFALLPQFSIARDAGNFTLHASGFLPASSVDLFGSSWLATSYLDAGAFYSMNRSKYAFGFSETVINQRTLGIRSPDFARVRSEGLRVTALARLSTSSDRDLTLIFGVVPYLHVASYFTTEIFPSGVRTFARSRPGALVDASLRWKQRIRSFNFVYGLRYLNQSVNLASDIPIPGRPTMQYIQHDSSLMPFVGISKTIGP